MINKFVLNEATLDKQKTRQQKMKNYLRLSTYDTCTMVENRTKCLIVNFSILALFTNFGPFETERRFVAWEFEPSAAA